MLAGAKGKWMPLSDANLEGLIRLLDEPDAATVDGLLTRVSALEPDDMDRLLARARQSSEQVRGHVYSALNRNIFTRLEPEWQRLAAMQHPNLEAALTLLGRTRPDCADVPVARKLDELAAEVGATLSGDRAFDNGLGAMGRVFKARGLAGNTQDYYDPGNSYLSRVLETGLGIPISLCAVAMLVGQRLELPVHGIGTPGHFLGFYGDPYVGVGGFFDPFGGFKRLTTGEIQTLIGQYAPGPVDPRSLKPATEREILSRTLGNLIGCYTARGEVERARGVTRWRGILGGMV